ncbi:MAG: hydroxymethylglutaryl-CoA lyase [Bacteroidetes bacterium]|nr:hydroxymethylglutaryl-CoA lyase [Bacteroidota bacterium]
MIKIIESPREGMQAVERFIPTEDKVRFINSLLRAGFHTVELGSIVNPKVIPQMADTLEIIRKLDFSFSISDRMVLVMNAKGAALMAGLHEIDTISYPFSFSSSFLMLNLRSTIPQALKRTQEILDICENAGKKAVIYISYAFGNPYGDKWSLELLMEWIWKLKNMGARVIPLSNVSVEISDGLIHEVFTALRKEFPGMEFGLHLHTSEDEWRSKVDAAYQAGCRRFDTVINGYGGCPMTGKELLGNLMTQNMVKYLKEKGFPEYLNENVFQESIRIAEDIYR